MLSPMPLSGAKQIVNTSYYITLTLDYKKQGAPFSRHAHHAMTLFQRL